MDLLFVVIILGHGGHSHGGHSSHINLGNPGSHMAHSSCQAPGGKTFLSNTITAVACLKYCD